MKYLQKNSLSVISFFLNSISIFFLFFLTFLFFHNIILIFYTISRFAKKIYLPILFLFLFLSFICSDNILLIKSSLSYFSVNTKKTTFLLPFLCVYRIVFYQIIRSTVNSYTPSVFHRLLWLHDDLH